MLNKKLSNVRMLKLSSWCTAILDGKQVRVRVRHLGRGKFQVIEDESGTNNQKIIDASDIIHCDK
ncbi:hypothetical protein Ngar_c05280 [Candidatus Nitrososphaera gargensis Ga9.2]|uniref:Uncharacterized protein n=1 Tax=Nitrososphaera gargensis (strain Ga9.2) TaxID=1237085 RepID=K0I875_NITGG|nr:hypothetical protein Ngar_c05280 [Candidatus Nitrososphaera gargensis Ga9.2]